MFNALYIFWGLFPLTLFFFAGKAVYRRVFKIHGREFASEYLSQAIFCSIALALAIYLDQTVFEEFILAATIGGIVDIRILRFLLYPAILVALSYLQRILMSEGKKERRSRANRSKRVTYS